MSFGSSSGPSGVAGIVALLIMASCVTTYVSGTITHWIAAIAAIVVGLLAVQSINRKS